MTAKSLLVCRSRNETAIRDEPAAGGGRAGEIEDDADQGRSATTKLIEGIHVGVDLRAPGVSRGANLGLDQRQVRACRRRPSDASYFTPAGGWFASFVTPVGASELSSVVATNQPAPVGSMTRQPAMPLVRL